MLRMLGFIQLTLATRCFSNLSQYRLHSKNLMLFSVLGWRWALIFQIFYCSVNVGDDTLGGGRWVRNFWRPLISFIWWKLRVRDDLWSSAWAWDHKNLNSFIGSKHERSSIWVYTRVVWNQSPSKWPWMKKFVGILHGLIWIMLLGAFGYSFRWAWWK